MAPEPTLPGEGHANGVTGLARRCAREMARYQRRQEHNPRPCYELFRLALVERDQEAWNALYAQYQRLVACWLGAPDEADELANQAFARFWRAITPARFADFPTLGALLGYLKRCARGAAIDASRRAERQQRTQEARRHLHELGPEEALFSPAVNVLDQVAGEQLYEHVIRNLRSQRERLVFRASLVWDLKPGAIVDKWPDQFENAREVSRLKERIFRRLERDGELRALLGVE